MGLRFRTVNIRCPCCGMVQETQVEWADKYPWPFYVQECEACGYVITESEWEEVT